ncbi:molecular chaperone DnaJ [Tsukamurella sp. 8F]|uniref:molecular chaperone DnaJ n=1 Tax=unclassified Tsukamurella TaxID=2633480 RepID=UPI0023B9C61B|nr:MULTISPECIES: molecular chaperone DnaJ [unclassified Tsukamurella]MDF0528535.1 molecular chaperone DnaJ [Tsukamurella sp. 8J]MDF0586361.1 molecular chaperone DnaJ [Tsukamurella sp. 8F]
MAQREWVEQDFYKELGVSSDASQDDIKRAYRKLAAELHPDRNPNDRNAEDRFKRVSEANSVLSDPAKRKEYDETRRMFGSGGRFGGGGGFSGNAGGSQGFSFSDIFDGAASAGGGLGDLFDGLFNRGGGSGGPGPQPTPSRPRRGSDLESEITLDFRDATLGVTTPITLTSPSPCTTCHGSGARPGTSPRVCVTCNGAGLVSRNQGAFSFSEPCPDCRGTGSVVDDPCPDCSGTGVTVRTRKVNVKIPPGVADGQRIRLAGQGQAGMRGAPSGDLFVTVHVSADKVFSRKGDDLQVTLPVSFSELALGATVTVPTLGQPVGVKIPAGTPDGRTLRVRGRGVPKRTGGAGDLLVKVSVAVPGSLDDKAADALRAYTDAERASGFDPRSGWAGSGAGGSGV